MEKQNKKYIVIDKKQESQDVFTLDLELENEGIPDFIPGQYINIYFPELHTPEGKAYTISSAPSEQKFSITIKVIGEFSSKLNSLQIGESLEGSLPYGFFFTEEKNTNLVCIAGGIGVTPFRSMLVEEINKKSNRRCTLVHSIKKEGDMIFNDIFSEKPENISVQYFITQQSNIQIQNAHQGRIVFKDLQIPNISQSEFFLCGSIPFVRDMWNMLRKNNISEYQIYTEAFFSH